MFKTSEVSVQGTSDVREKGIASDSAQDVYVATMKTMYAESAHREIFYKVLTCVAVESDEKFLSEKIRALPEMRVNVRTPRFYLDRLFESGALDRALVNEDTCDTEIAEASSSDSVATNDAGGEVDVVERDWAESSQLIFMWNLTEVGTRILEDMAPSQRLLALMGDEERYRNAYLSILEFCAEPRRRTEIDDLLAGNEALENPHVLPSFFVDRLEKNGGLIWDGGWKTTVAGEGCLS